MASNGTKRLKTDTDVLHFFRAPGYAEPNIKKLNFKIKAALPEVEAVETEFCFNVQLSSTSNPLTEQEQEVGRRVGEARGLSAEERYESK